MKTLKMIFAILAVATLSSKAFAFITVIDVEVMPGEYKTIQTGSDYSFSRLEGKYLSYRGQGAGAARLFEELVQNEFPASVSRVEAEINEETGTVAITVALNGYLGFEYRYYILKRASL